MAKRFLYLLLIVGSLCSCKYKVPDTFGWNDYSSIPVISFSKDSLPILDSDTLYIATDFREIINSMAGHFFLKQDTLCFADEGTGSILEYDLSGKYIRTMVSKGRGRNEILGLTVASIDNQNRILTLDSSWGFNLFDETGKKQIFRYINFDHSERTFKDILKHPNPLLMDIYSFSYDKPSLKLYDGRYAIFPISSEHENYNAYQGKNVEHYYRNARIFGICDLRGRTIDMFGGYSPWYYENCIANFNDVLFDVDENNLYYSFGADSLIYVMDIPTRKIILGFGKSGKEMNQNYKRYDSFDESENNFFKDRAKYGYYGNLKYEPETKRIFRTYYQGNDTNYEYMQVYENYLLIGEIKVPKGSYYVGYINGWTYFASENVDYDKDQFMLFRYKFS